MNLIRGGGFLIKVLRLKKKKKKTYDICGDVSISSVIF